MALESLRVGMGDELDVRVRGQHILLFERPRYPSGRRPIV